MRLKYEPTSEALHAVAGYSGTIPCCSNLGSNPSGMGFKTGLASSVSALEAIQGQMDGFFSQLPYKCHLEEVASVGN